ncbi:MAG: ribosome-associated translation inhibitor RaiA [Candidatus Limnocylindrales bacterium]
MRTIVKGKNLDIPEADRAYVERKMSRLERILDDRSEALVELSVERHKSADESHIVEVSLVVDGRPIHGAARAPTHHAAVDEVVDKLERRVVDDKERPRQHSRHNEEKHLLASIADGTSDADVPRPRVVKVKRFAIEPMFEEDAVARMVELGHSFFVFVNAENEQTAVLYRRRDGDYGMIEPNVGGTYSGGQSATGRRR